MITPQAVFNDKTFIKEINNILDYSVGFTEGVQRGKKRFLDSFGAKTVQVLKSYIDSSARTNPAMLHHIYEWYQVGSPAARLFDIEFMTGNSRISFIPRLTQSTSVKDGSSTPFYNKAEVMERGTPVVVRPRNAQTLAFEVDGEKVFTSNPVTIDNPGGAEAQGGFERIINSFFNNYFSQSFLRASGIDVYLKDASLYSKNIGYGKRGGRSAGVSIGYQWIVSAGEKL